MIKKLVVTTLYRICEEVQHPQRTGFEFTYFMDPETKKLYKPTKDFEVTGENLEGLFQEVKPEDRW